METWRKDKTIGLFETDPKTSPFFNSYVTHRSTLPCLSYLALSIQRQGLTEINMKNIRNHRSYHPRLTEIRSTLSCSTTQKDHQDSGQITQDDKTEKVACCAEKVADRTA